MNGLKKAYCRGFQCVFSAAMPVLPYREPRILDSVTEVEPVLRKLGVRRVMLVTDHVLRSSGVTAELEKLLRDGGIRCIVYDKTLANPTVHNVEEARRMYLRGRCQGLIALGGGSSMDCAKGVGARIAHPGKSLEQLKGLLRVWRRLPLLIAIPTTAGTGSEVTLTAVITDTRKKHKYTINSFPLIPHYAVLDPKITYTLPPHLTATTGMDALTHGVEAYIGRSTTKETRRLALQAVRLIFTNIEKACRDGSDYTARHNMLLASYKAGIAFSKSYVGYVHGVAHSLGGQYDIPHGLANAVLLPVVLEAYGKTAEKKLHQLGIAAGVCRKEDSHERGARKFISAIRTLNHRLGIPETLPGIRKRDISVLARHAAGEANPLYPVPKLMDAWELEVFYERVADWSEQDAH